MLEDNVPGNLTMQYLSNPNFQGSTLLQEAFPNRSFAEFTAEMESYSNVSVNNDLNSFLWRLSFMSNRGIKDYKDCLSVDSGNRIVGGDISYEDSWPYTVAVYRDGRFICGATILSPQWVVTAGHCLFQYEEGDGKFYYVRAGMIRRQSQSAWEQHRSLQQIFIHPEYDNTFLKHDLALARLNEPLTLNRHVQAICLPHDSSHSPPPGSTCVAAGWGDLSEDGPSSEQLREVEVPILDQCGRSYNNIEYQICGGHKEGGKDACQGDSGGPLYCWDRREKVCRDECPNSRDGWDSCPDTCLYLGGIISHGRGCARADEPGVYVRLSYYTTWLQSVLAGEAVAGLPAQRCPGVQCGSGECVPANWVCDGQVDCLDAGDEAGCTSLANKTRVQLARPQSVTTQGTVTTTQSTVTSYTTEDLERDWEFTRVVCEADQWKCAELEQCVSGSARCDGRQDCPDGSDETNCDCRARLAAERLCDGVEDCRDGKDEEDCQLCEDPEAWRCPLSGQCIPATSHCNAEPDCELEEDERDCTALYNSSSQAGGPGMAQGLLYIQRDHTWAPLCVAMFSPGLADSLCRYMGWPGTAEEGLPGGFKLQDRQPGATCSNVEVACEAESCGLARLYRNLPTSKRPPSRGPGVWPWQASFFNEGEYICGGTIVHRKFVLTHLECAKQVATSGTYITVLAGQERRAGRGLGPASQLRRVVSLKVEQGSIAVLAELDRDLALTARVSTLCLADPAPKPGPSTACLLAGATPSSYSHTLPVTVSYCSEGYCLTADTSVIEAEQWAGLLACPDSRGVYSAAGVYWSSRQPSTALPLSGVGGLLRIMEEPTVLPPPQDSCSGLRCRLGQCLSATRVCDGVWDCGDGEDELDCPAPPSTNLTLCREGTGGRCHCPIQHRPCSNNLCLDTELWCNGRSECGDGSDEPGECDDCLARLQLLFPDRVCDGQPDCPGGQDETVAACGCPAGTARCPGSPVCVPRSQLCDGRPDCPGGEEEEPRHCLALEPLDPMLAPLPATSGYLKVQIYGVWYTYCSPTWSAAASELVCTSLGFSGPANTTALDSTAVTLGSDEAGEGSCQTLQISCSTILSTR